MSSFIDTTSLKNNNEVVFVNTDMLQLYTLGEKAALSCYVQFHCCHKNFIKLYPMLCVAQNVHHTCNLLPMPLQQYVLTTPLGEYTHLTWL